ncbi:hypothetical protein CLOM_g3254 [Closterium sp. NIES-68]|nr:hypothetical protein CLOM_g3254 [Closterium sp. NIES-68]GJP76406.1 hypothetical protein CLOP_g6856 [Closterium sp. NIES-67]
MTSSRGVGACQSLPRGSNAMADAPNIPLSLAYGLWSDRELVPNWMPWITSVKVLKETPEFSEWTLKYTAFGRDLEFSWLSKQLTPIVNQKIQWRSVDGVPNRGAVRFFPRGPNGCKVEMTLTYQCPDILVPVMASLSPLVENIIQADMDRFVDYATKVKDTQSVRIM